MQRFAVVLIALLIAGGLPVVGDAGAVDAAPAGTGAFTPVGPVRVADTRADRCGCERVDANTVRVSADDVAGMPDDTVAVALTVTALADDQPGYVTVYPGGTARPNTSTLVTRTDGVAANSTIVSLGDDGSIDIFRLHGGDVAIDVTGAFVATDRARAGRFRPMQPTRTVDTRLGSGPIAAGGTLHLPLPDGVPDDATALAVNITSVDETAPGYLSAFPAGSDPAPRGRTSFVNPDGSGRAVAAAMVVPVSKQGLSIYSRSGGHVAVDVTGWFTGASAANSDAGLFVPLTPERRLDTRERPWRVWADGTVHLGAPANAAAIVTNVTTTNADRRGFVTAYPAGTDRPPVSTVNPARFDHTIANLAITPVTDAGASYYSLGGTDLVVDISGYFTGGPKAATKPLAGNVYQSPRVLVVGDSALAVLRVYTDARVAFSNMDVFLDVDNCRRLVHESCTSPATGRKPTTALQAIEAAPGTFDIVYIDAAHNDWFDDDFGWQFDQIVQASRAKGATTILWPTQTEAVHHQIEQAGQAYVQNNIWVRQLAAMPAYDDVEVADWNRYSATHPEWFWDGTHMYRSGAYGVADYIARWAMALRHRPCNRPRVNGGPIADPCSVPDTVGAPPDVLSLY